MIEYEYKYPNEKMNKKIVEKYNDVVCNRTVIEKNGQLYSYENDDIDNVDDYLKLNSYADYMENYEIVEDILSEQDFYNLTREELAYLARGFAS